MYFTLWKYSQYFVYTFRTDGNCLTKYGSSSSSFHRNILTLPYLKFKTSAHAQIAFIHYYILFTSFLWIWNLQWRYSLMNEVGQWFYQLDHVTFSKNVFFFVNFALPFAKFISPKCQLNSLFKCWHFYWKVAHFVTSSRKVTWPYLWCQLVVPFFEGYSQWSFQLISCQNICK